VLALLTPSAPAPAQEGQTVDLELALLVDVSSSVNDEEFRLQAGGLAAAFQSPAVLEAIRRAGPNGIAVGVVQWADRSLQQVSVDWTYLRNEADALGLAARIAAMPRLGDGGHTALGDALGFGLRELASNRFAGLRRVIDLSSDGRNNDGGPLRPARQEAIDQGVTINGLAILNELPLLEQYFRKYLISGEGAFVMVAQDYTDFAQAIIHKLVREISSSPLSKHEAPNSVQEAQAESPLPAHGGRL
jgi:hypothetical protein